MSIWKCLIKYYNSRFFADPGPCLHSSSTLVTLLKNINQWFEMKALVPILNAWKIYVVRQSSWILDLSYLLSTNK